MSYLYIFVEFTLTVHELVCNVSDQVREISISICVYWDPLYSKTSFRLMLLSFFPSIFPWGQFPCAAGWCAVLLSETSNCFSLGCKTLFTIPLCAFHSLLHPSLTLGPSDLPLIPFLEWDLTPNPSELCPHTWIGEDHCYIGCYASFLVLVFPDPVSLCSSSCPETHSVGQGGLEHREQSASVSQVWSLKVCNATTTRLFCTLIATLQSFTGL